MISFSLSQKQEGEGEVVKKRSFKRSKSAEEQARRIKERNRRAQQVTKQLKPL